MKDRGSRRAAFLVAFMIALGGCSAGVPSEQQARGAVSEKLKEIGPLVDLTKADGESLEVMGQKLYRFHYRAAVTLGDGWAWRVKSELFNAGIQRRDAPFVLFKPKLDPIPSGATYIARGAVDFRKTENGWTHNGTTIDGYGYCSPGRSPSDCYKANWDSPQPPAVSATIDAGKAEKEAQKIQAQQKALDELTQLAKRGGSDLKGEGKAALKSFLDNGGDPNTSKLGTSLLMLASCSGYVDIMEMLVALGADINGIGTIEDGTPLYWAIEGGKTEAALYLINKGADVNREKSGGWRPLDAMGYQSPDDPGVKKITAALAARGAKAKGQ